MLHHAQEYFDLETAGRTKNFVEIVSLNFN
jgi:hypothetical protein